MNKEIKQNDSVFVGVNVAPNATGGHNNCMIGADTGKDLTDESYKIDIQIKGFRDPKTGMIHCDDGMVISRKLLTGLVARGLGFKEFSYQYEEATEWKLADGEIEFN